MTSRDPSPTPGGDAGRWCDQAARWLRGRKLILVGGPVASLGLLAAQLRALGAEPPFLLANGLGTGALPGPDVAAWHALDVRGATIVDAIRALERALLDLPPEARAALDRYDPEGQALVCGGVFLDGVERIAGRRRWAARPPRFAALEDKSRIDSFWDACGVSRAPSVTMPAQGALLRAAARRVDRGAGTVWSGDARDGANGGGVYVRWVRTESDHAGAEAFFAPRCARVRVMPFLEGIPCSIHALVFDDGVAVFRPVEMVTLRRTGSSEFAYAGGATYWDPAPADRSAMRSVARRVASFLRERLDYRGGFSIDGVMSADGFLPTELNPRFSAGLNLLAASAPEVPLWWLGHAALAGDAGAVGAASLEEYVVAAADRSRNGGAWLAFPKPVCDPISRRVVEAEGDYRLAAESEPHDGALHLGPGEVGGFVRFAPRPGAVESGPSFAPRAARALALADRSFGLSLGRLEAAAPVR